MIPPRRSSDGLALNAPAATLPVIEVFLDPLCPDSRDVWPGIVQAAHAQVAHFRVVTLPLPYHRNAFILTQAVHAVALASNDTPATVIKAMSFLFEHLEELGSKDASSNEHEYRRHTAELVWAAVPEVHSHFTDHVDGFAAQLKSGSPADQAARRAFKFAAHCQATGTPNVRVNGVMDERAEELTTVADWERYIASLG
ncbi:hypothetical protein BC828DRAFT_393003 [Blastocladiella britannica]|nr:hypothetical protein BC828DRAFT_393003 [Blastocladiella britannica]